jgi:hypothetical protein
MKKLYPNVAVAILWSVFSIWICFREEQYFWVILLISLGCIPLIWQLYFEKYFAEVTQKKIVKVQERVSTIIENKTTPDKFMDCERISTGYGEMVILSDMIFLEDGLIVALYSSLYGWQFLLGLLGRRIALKKRKRMSAEIKNLNPENTLLYSKENFKISYSEITKSELKKQRILFNNVSVLKLHTSNTIHRFSLMGKNKLKPEKGLLSDYKKILIDRFSDIIIK